jgi:hypothetical protein
VTREQGPVPYRGASGRPGLPAADLGAIRRSEEIIEMLAGRRVPARALSDPVVALLSRLTADIDAAPGHAVRPGGSRHRARRACPAGAWPHAAAAAVAAAIATLTAVAAAGLLIVGWATAMRKPRSPSSCHRIPVRRQRG